MSRSRRKPYWDRTQDDKLIEHAQHKKVRRDVKINASDPDAVIFSFKRIKFGNKK